MRTVMEYVFERPPIDPEDLHPKDPLTQRPGDITSAPIPAQHAARWATPSWWIALAVIAPCWAVSPACWAWTVWRLLGFAGKAELKLTAVGWAALDVYAAIEVLFSIYYQYLRHQVQPSTPPRPFSEDTTIAELERLFELILDAGMGFPLEDTEDDPHRVTGKNGLGPDLTILSPHSSGEHLNPNGTPNGEGIRKPKDREFLDYDDPRAISYRQKFRLWFLNKPINVLTTESIYQWLSWSLFSAPYTPEAFGKVKNDLLDATLSKIEHRCGYKFPAPSPAGNSPKIKPIRLTLDPVMTASHPLIFYLIVCAINKKTELDFIRKHDFKVVNVKMVDEKGKRYTMRYLSRTPEGWDRKTGGKPIVFVHGLGLGLGQYSLLVSTLTSNPKVSSKHPIMIPIQPHVSMDIFSNQHLDPPKNLDVVNCLREAVNKTFGEGSGMRNKNEDVIEQDIEKDVEVIVWSHSNGSVVHAQFLRAYPHMVTRHMFVDPVVFCLWEGDVCYNFCYRQPNNGLDFLMSYFVSTELGVSHYVARRFDWSINTLFAQEVPNGTDPTKAVYMLGGRDSVVDARGVVEYLRREGVKKNGLHFLDECSHGQSLVAGGEGMQILVKWLEDNN